MRIEIKRADNSKRNKRMMKYYQLKEKLKGKGVRKNDNR